MIKNVSFKMIIIVVFVLIGNFANSQDVTVTNSTAKEVIEKNPAATVEVPPVVNVTGIGTSKLSLISDLIPPKESVSNSIGVEKSGSNAVLNPETFPAISAAGFDDFGTDFLSSFPNTAVANSIDFSKLGNIAAAKPEVLPAVSLFGFGSDQTQFLPNFLNGAVNSIDVKNSTNNTTEKAEVSPAIILPKFGDFEAGLLPFSLSETTTKSTEDTKSGNNTTTKVGELPAVSLPNFGNFGSGFDLGFNDFIPPESYTPYIAPNVAFSAYDGGLQSPLLNILNPFLTSEYSTPEIYLKK